MPILIGKNLFIEELPVDYSGKILDLNPYITPLNTFFDNMGVWATQAIMGVMGVWVFTAW